MPWLCLGGNRHRENLIGEALGPQQWGRGLIYNPCQGAVNVFDGEAHDQG